MIRRDIPAMADLNTILNYILQIKSQLDDIERRVKRIEHAVRNLR
jgi:hypothetical protein